MRNIPTVTRNLLVINTICYLMSLLWGTQMDTFFGLHFMLAPDFHMHQLFTYMFLHGGFTHLLFNMFALWMFGCVVESTWGPRRFLLFYTLCGIGAGLFQEAAQLVHFFTICPGNGFPLSAFMQVAHANSAYLNLWTTVGASGAIYGILLAFAMLYPDERIFVFPLPVPVKAKWLVAGYAVIEVVMAMSMPGDGVAHLAHLGGMLVGWLLIRYWRSHPGAGCGMNGLFGTRGRWTARRRKAKGHGLQGGGTSGHEADWEYNARRKASQAETDRILDKIRRSGYDSLTAAEKEHLFNNRN